MTAKRLLAKVSAHRSTARPSSASAGADRVPVSGRVATDKPPDAPAARPREAPAAPSLPAPGMAAAKADADADADAETVAPIPTTAAGPVASPRSAHSADSSTTSAS